MCVCLSIHPSVRLPVCLFDVCESCSWFGVLVVGSYAGSGGKVCECAAGGGDVWLHVHGDGGGGWYLKFGVVDNAFDCQPVIQAKGGKCDPDPKDPHPKSF